MATVIKIRGSIETISISGIFFSAHNNIIKLRGGPILIKEYGIFVADIIKEIKASVDIVTTTALAVEIVVFLFIGDHNETTIGGLNEQTLDELIHNIE